MEPSYRFSGHETFACRYAWLPKATKELASEPLLFTGEFEDEAMVRLGVGKNMVRAIRFWAEVSGVTEAREEGGARVSSFGTRLLLGQAGVEALDPFLEDIQTLWLLHWNISTQMSAPLFAWDFLLNRWQLPHLTRTSVLQAFRSEANLQKRELSDVTLDQHWDVFLHTYVPTRGKKGEVLEDSLDSPFTELDLFHREGIREATGQPGKSETIYAFNRNEKPEIGMELFAWCLDEFWRKRHSSELTMSFGTLVSGHGGPGQIFKLPEDDIRQRLERIESVTDGQMKFNDAALTPKVERQSMQPISWENIYGAACL